jgi:DNA polymerase elongation subunit (family B)
MSTLEEKILIKNEIIDIYRKLSNIINLNIEEVLNSEIQQDASKLYNDLAKHFD